MGYPLLDQLRRLKAPEFSDRTIEFMNETTCCDVEDRIQEGLRYRIEYNRQVEQLKRGEIADAKGIEINVQLSENEMRRAEVLCQVAASERGYRLGRIRGNELVLEARQFAANELRSSAPWLDDVGPCDDK